MSSHLRNQFSSYRDGLGLARQRDLRHLYFLGRLLKYTVWVCALTLLALNLWTAWPNYLTGLPGLDGPQAPLLLVEFMTFSFFLPSVFVQTIRWGTDSSLTHMQAYTLALRHAIAARDATVAPTADDTTPETAFSDANEAESTPVHETLAPLAHPSGSFGFAEATYLFFAIASLVLLGVGVYFGALFTPGNYQLAEPFWWNVPDLVLPALFAIGGLICFTLSLNAWLWARRERREMIADVHEDGVTLRLAGSRKRAWRVRWSDTQGFARLRYLDDAGRVHIVYVLSAMNDDLLWDEPPALRYGPAHEIARTDAMRVAAQRLKQIVERRAGLPLLDITAITRAARIANYGANQVSTPLFGIAITIARGWGDTTLATDLWRGTHPDGREPHKYEVSRIRPSQLFLYTTPEQRNECVHYALAMLPYYPTAEQATPDPRERLAIERRSRVARRQNAFGLAFLLAAMMVSGLGYGLSNWYSPPLLRALPAQTQVQTPLYLAPFSVQQSDWPMFAPLGADTRSARFTSYGYELTAHDPSQAVGAWTQFMTLADGAMQVTMRLTNAGPNADAASGGILLNVHSDGSSALAFTVDQDGRASLSRCHNLSMPYGECDDRLVSTFVDDMGTNNGVATDLLVIRRGQMYFCYVNDTPIIVYRDTSSVAGAPGYVGVYLDQGAATADFTNLSVYPTPPQLPFWAR